MINYFFLILQAIVVYSVYGIRDCLDTSCYWGALWSQGFPELQCRPRLLAIHPIRYLSSDVGLFDDSFLRQS